MTSLLFHWSTDDEAGQKSNPPWQDVQSWISQISNGKGIISLETNDVPQTPYRSLQVRYENGNYLLTLGEEAEDDWHVRSYRNPANPAGQVPVLGDYWSASMIFQDQEIVSAAFKEFYDCGNVSELLLN